MPTDLFAIDVVIVGSLLPGVTQPICFAMVGNEFSADQLRHIVTI
jgi:hypothetical protein